LDARDVWCKISVKIVNREHVIRGKKPLPAGEHFRIIRLCISATNEQAEESEKTNEQSHANLTHSLCYSTFPRFE
jgi:hypothetical protein